MRDFVTEQMEEGLLALQTVPSFNYEAAYNVVYSGINVLDPRRSASHAELIYGRSLAITVWTKRMEETLNLRYAA